MSVSVENISQTLDVWITRLSEKPPWGISITNKQEDLLSHLFRSWVHFIKNAKEYLALAIINDHFIFNGKSSLLIPSQQWDLNISTDINNKDFVVFSTSIEQVYLLDYSLDDLIKRSNIFIFKEETFKQIEGKKITPLAAINNITLTRTSINQTKNFLDIHFISSDLSIYFPIDYVYKFLMPPSVKENKKISLSMFSEDNENRLNSILED